MGIFNKLAWFFKAEWKNYLAGIIALILVALTNVIPPRLIGLIVDKITAHKLSLRLLGLYLGLFLSAALAQYLLRYSWRKYIFGGSIKLEKTLRQQLFNHFLKMDPTFYQKRRIGDLMAHATNDVDAVRDVAGPGILTLADSLITGLSTIIAMCLFVNWRLTLLAVLPLPLLAVMSSKLGGRIHQAFGQAQAAFSDLNNKVQESMLGVKVIKSLGQESEDQKDFEAHVKQAIAANKRAYFLDALFDPLTTLILGLSYVAIIILGGKYVLEKTISLGQLVTFISYMGALVWPMFAIGRLFNILERGNASYDRILILLGQKPAWVKPKTEVKPTGGTISFALTSFSFPGEHQKRLSNINFELKAGQTLGIVGETGAGKTTILRLLLREFDHYQGKISLANHDIRDYQLDDYLSQLGYVSQTSFLFSTTIKDNISFARPNASLAAIKEAAKLADISKDIEQMPQGYDTLVGEMGTSLSGGQKQRLALARAFLAQPEIMLLDDALSAVDAKTEQNILESLQAKRAGQTTIIAASRLSSVSQADLILVIAGGKIIQRGKHAELLSQPGWYQDTYRLQEKKEENRDG